MINDTEKESLLSSNVGIALQLILETHLIKRYAVIVSNALLKEKSKTIAAHGEKLWLLMVHVMILNQNNGLLC